MKIFRGLIMDTKNEDGTPGMFLFVLSLFVILLCPIPVAFFPEYTRLIFELSFSFVVIAGVGTITRKNNQHYIGYVLGILGIITIWIAFIDAQYWLIWLKIIVLFLFVNFLSFHIFRHIFFHKKMSINIILAAIAGYMLLGFGGGLLCQMVELSIPGSFSVDGKINLFQLTYFSYSTLITLGFGDIIPFSAAAKSLALIISISGQLYLTILIAIIVGKFLSNPSKSE